MDVAWGLGERVVTEVGEVAYGVFGKGPPVVLVHGTPSRSYLWRGVVGRLAGRHAVYVYDLPGFGESERYERQDVSIAAQGRVLAELVDAWGLGRGRRSRGTTSGVGSCSGPTCWRGSRSGRSRSSTR